MQSTYLQTADVFFPNAEFAHQTLEHRPTKPAWAVDSPAVDPIAVQEEDRVVLWWPDGLCQVYQQDGILKEFWPKPTLSEVVAVSGEGVYTRFHKDSSVEQIFKGKPYYWGSDILMEDSNGYEIEPILYMCEDTPYGWFMINGMKVSFSFSENSPYWGQPCGCAECHFERRCIY